MTINQDSLDNECLKARVALDNFRKKNRSYFEFCGRIDPNTDKLYYPNQMSLDRESFRLFDICRKANKSALDFEYNNRCN